MKSVIFIIVCAIANRIRGGGVINLKAYFRKKGWVK